jgi:hypothetical protein
MIGAQSSNRLSIAAACGRFVVMKTAVNEEAVMDELIAQAPSAACPDLREAGRHVGTVLWRLITRADHTTFPGSRRKEGRGSNIPSVLPGVRSKERKKIFSYWPD